MITTSTRVEDADIAGLLERVEKATGPDSDLDRDIVNGLGFHAWAGRMSYRDSPMWIDFGASAVTGSVDAALALADKKTPDIRPRLDFDERPRCYFHNRNGLTIGAQPTAWLSYADAPTMPLAILAAFLRSLLTRSRP